MSPRYTRALARVLGITALAAAGCASPTPEQLALPELSEADSEAAFGFEAPAPARAADLLPADLLTGPHHTVAEIATPDGFAFIYTVESDYGTFPARGEDLLRIRIREVEALSAIDEMSKHQEFARAMAVALRSPFVATWNLIAHPVDSITGIPNAAWSQLRRTANLARGDRSEYEDSALREFIGFEEKKREISSQLAVDPYTSNSELQTQLNRYAWAAYLGGLPSKFVPFQGPGEDAEAAAGGFAFGASREKVLHYSPEDLRSFHRIELAVMGVPEGLADRFLAHPWYSPSHQTVLVDSLAAMDLTRDRAVFIETATRARSEEDALFFQRAAELLYLYGRRVSRIERTLPVGRSAAGLSEDGTIVVPVILDRALWTGPAERFAETLVRAVSDESDAVRGRILFSGAASPLAVREFRKRGVEITEHAFEALAAPARASGE